MPNLIGRQEMAVDVDYGGWALQDWDDTQVPVTFPGGFERGPFLSAHAGRLDFSSGGHTHTADLVVEVWDSEPASPPGQWEERGEANIYCSSGKLRARSVAGGPMPGRIELSDGPGTWGVRVVSAGRRQAAELSTHGVPEGVERYMAQFWPET
ncbi:MULTISPECIES: hypothetical protein [Streptomyces]|uniref:hypothetical protein n=1 Tax=Streptomyces TaxID=1883 RepID=UPI001F0B6FF3|nr:hypothetical protein [Streptomyces hirsutus]